MDGSTAKKISILLGISFIFFTNVYAKSISSGLMEMMSKSSGLKRLAKDVGPIVTKRIGVDEFKKLFPKIPKSKITDAMLTVGTVQKKFISHGPFAKNFLHHVKEPGEVLRQFAKYGDEYPSIAQKVSANITKNIDSIATMSSKELKNMGMADGMIKKLKNTGPNFKSEKYISDAFVHTLKRTGKKGYEQFKKIIKWGIKNPTPAMITASFLWYITDPEGFSESFNVAGQKIGGFVSDAATKPVEGLLQGLKEKALGKNLPYSIIAVIIAIIVFVGPLRRLLFLPLKVLGKKIDGFVDKKRSTISNKKVEKANRNGKKKKSMYR